MSDRIKIEERVKFSELMKRKLLKLKTEFTETMHSMTRIQTGIAEIMDDARKRNFDRLKEHYPEVSDNDILNVIKKEFIRSVAGDEMAEMAMKKMDERTNGFDISDILNDSIN